MFRKLISPRIVNSICDENGLYHPKLAPTGDTAYIRYRYNEIASQCLTDHCDIIGYHDITNGSATEAVSSTFYTKAYKLKMLEE